MRCRVLCVSSTPRAASANTGVAVLGTSTLAARIVDPHPAAASASTTSPERNAANPMPSPDGSSCHFLGPTAPGMAPTKTRWLP